MTTSQFDFNSLSSIVSVNYVGQVIRDNWDCDQWRVQINIGYNPSAKHAYQFFDYFTGSGHRKLPKSEKYSVELIKKQYGQFAQPRIDKLKKPVKPDIKGIMHSLIMDSDAINTSFTNWCDDYGYDSDSINARNIYDACCENAGKFKQCFTQSTIDAMREALRDY